MFYSFYFSDCSLDETCVLCEKCFNYDAHKDHNFWYTIGNTNSGSCDCGEDDSWKNDLKCPHHVIKVSSEDLFKNSSPHSLKKLMDVVCPILANVMESLNKYSRSRNAAKTSESVVLLYNDENHSFDDVINILCTEIEIGEEAAEAYANLVDSKVRTLNINFIIVTFSIGIRPNFGVFSWDLCQIKSKI